MTSLVRFADVAALRAQAGALVGALRKWPIEPMRIGSAASGRCLLEFSDRAGNSKLFKDQEVVALNEENVKKGRKPIPLTTTKQVAGKTIKTPVRFSASGRGRTSTGAPGRGRSRRSSRKRKRKKKKKRKKTKRKTKRKKRKRRRF